MATLYVREYAGIGVTPNVSAIGPGFLATQAPYEPAAADQIVSISGSSTQSTVFGQNTTMVRIHTDAICSIVFGSNPTATSSSARLAANQTEYFHVVPGHKVAVITNV